MKTINSLAVVLFLFLSVAPASAKHPAKPKVSVIDACKAAHTFLAEWNGRGDFYIISADYIHDKPNVAPYWRIKIADSNLDRDDYLNLYVGMDLEYSIIPPSPN